MPPIRPGLYRVNAALCRGTKDNSGRLLLVVIDVYDEEGNRVDRIQQDFADPISTAALSTIVAGLNSGKIERWDLG